MVQNPNPNLNYTEYDGFLCIRESRLEDAGHLASALRRVSQWKVLTQERAVGLRGINGSYLENARAVIEQASFAIVLVEPRGIPSGGQSNELNLIVDRIRHAPNTEQGNPFQLFVVAVTGPDRNDPRTGLSAEQALRHVEKATGWTDVLHNRTTYEFVCLGDIQAQELFENISNLANDISSVCMAANVKSKAALAGGTETGGNILQLTRTQSEDPPEIVTIEARYLQRARRNWVQGIIDQGDESKSASIGLDGESPFFFNANRFLILNAHLVSANTGRAKVTHKRPSVFEFLLSRNPNPMMLVGPPGSGKSTTLAMTAALLANRLESGPRSRTELLSKIEASLSDPLRINREVGFFPVALRATRIFEAPQDETGHDNLLLAAISEEIFSASPEDTTPNSERQRIVSESIRTRSYAILIDGMDELFDETKVNDLLSHAEEIYDEFGDERIKVIFGHRTASRYDRSGIVDVVKLNAPTTEQIQIFLNEYAQSQGEDTEDFKARVSRYNQPNARQSAIDLFHTPLLLNSFCWYIANLREFQGTQKELLDNVIDHLLGARHSKLAEAGFNYTSEQLRNFLRVMAYKRLETHLDSDKISFQLCVRAFKEAAGSMGINGVDDKVTDLILNFLTVHTGLIAKDKKGRDASYKFTVPLFCEILAGEWIFENELTDRVLASLDTISDLKMWDRSLAAALDAYFQSDQPAKAMVIPETILTRIENDHRGINLNEWIDAIRLILSRKTFKSVAEEEGRTSPLQPVFERIGALIRGHREELDALLINRAMSSFLKMGLRTSPNQSQRACSNLYKCMGFDFDLRAGNWSSLASIGESDLSIAKFPVLSCQFLSFVQECDVAEETPDNLEIWDHAPPQFADVRMEDEELLNESPWVERAVDVWSQLEDNPAAPMVYVNWFEATAYARWCTRKAINAGDIGPNDIFRLPSQAEWEAVSLALTKGKFFPWENQKPDSQAANWRETRIGAATVPGVFEACKTLDILDFGTNVKSWAQVDTSWPPSETPHETYVTVLGGSFRSRLIDLEPKRSPRKFITTTRQMGLGFRLIWERRRT